jgi:hypothetical protein
MSESDGNTVLWFEEITQRTSLIDRLQTFSVRVIEKRLRVHRQYGPLFIYLQSLSSRVRGPLWLGAPRQDSVAEPGQLIRVWDALCAPHPCLHASRAQSVASLCVTRTRDTQTPRGTACDHRASFLVRCHSIATFCGCDRWLQNLSSNPHQ